MKLTIFFFLVSINNLCAQYVPIDAKNAVWNNVDYECDAGPNCNYEAQQYLTDGDTIFGDHTYKKLYRNFNAFTDLIGFIREDSLKRVYYHTIEPFCPNDTIFEYLLYDFSLEIGDTLALLMPDHNDNSCQVPYLNKKSEVVAIDSIMLVNGEYRKRFVFASEDWGLYEHSYIEGIGSSIDLIYPLKEYSLDGWHFGHSSICYLQEGTIEYIRSGWSEMDCGIDFTDNVKEQRIENRFNVFPNPAIDFIVIESLKENDLELNIQIYKSNGILVKTLSRSVNQQFSVSFLQAGFYIIKFEIEDQVYFSRFIKLN